MEIVVTETILWIDNCYVINQSSLLRIANDFDSYWGLFYIM